MAKTRSDVANRAALQQLTNVVFTLVRGLSYVEANSLFRGSLEDFTSGVHFLLETLDGLSPQQRSILESAADLREVHRDLKPTLRRLCELSREVTFSADLTRLPNELRNAVERLFQFVGELVPELADEEAANYVANMRERTLKPIAVV